MNALFIAYYFPPIGGSGTQRSAKFVKYLADFAIQPIVITGSGPSGSRWEPEDSSLLNDVPQSVPILRAAERTPSDGSLTRWWASQINKFGTIAAAAYDPSVILVTLAPYQGLAPTLALGRQLGLPVVADLRDPWALDEIRSYRSWLHRLRDRRTMGATLARCARVVMNTEEAARAVLETFGGLDANRVTVIPNGFDKDDFRPHPLERIDDRFQIVHAGYLHTELAGANRRLHVLKRLLGGSMWGVDLEPRSHVYLLRGLERLAEDHPTVAEHIEIVLAGILTNADREVIDTSPFGHQVRQLGYVDHSAAVNLMMSADALFLPLHQVPNGERSRIVPGKTYEYLASGTPIVAAVPPGDTRDLIDQSGAGIAVDPMDASGIAQAVLDIADRPDGFRVDPTILSRFERRNQTRELAAVLRQAVLDPAPGA